MNKNRTTLVYISIALLAFIYVLIRAVTVEVTYDEAWTIQGFVGNTVWDIITYRILDTNNHMINTLLIKLLFASGNTSLFLARLPNVLAFIPYLYFGYRCCSKFVGGMLGICAFLLLLFDPFLIDFFSLARGYGLFLSAEMVSLYYLLLFFRDKKASYAALSLSLGAIAVLCNFSVLNYWLIILFLINVLPLFFRNEFEPVKVLRSSLLITVGLAIIIYEPLRKLNANGNMKYFGGHFGFYHDTMLSLMRCSVYTPNLYQGAYILLHILTIIFFATVVLSFSRSGLMPLSSRNIMLYALATGILSAIVQHYLFGALYLVDRIALFFYPIIILGFCLSLKEVLAQWYGKAIAAVITVSFGCNFFANVNFNKTALWGFNAHTTTILEHMNEEGRKQNKIMKLDFSWPFKTAIKYYTTINKYPYIQVINDPEEKNEVNKTADYYIFESAELYGSDYNGSLQPIDHMLKDTVMAYKNEDVFVFTHLR